MAIDPRSFYDDYWAKRDRTRTEARSRERAALTLDLLQAGLVRAGRLLDVGCGPGWTLEIFKAAGYEAVGLDAAGRAVDDAKSRGLDVRRIDLEREDPAAVLGGDARFDAVVALEVLEHVADPLGILASLCRLLSDRGVLIVSLPNEVTLPARMRILGGRLPFGGHADPHLRHFDRAGALRLFEAAQLRVKEERRVSLLPPRWKALRALTALLPRFFPGLFALATLFLVVPKELQSSDAK